MESLERRQAVLDAVGVLLRDCRLDSESAARHLQALGVSIAAGEVAAVMQRGREQLAASSEWSDKEHIAEPVVMDAQKLVDATGSIELAKKVVDTVGRRNAEVEPHEGEACRDATCRLAGSAPSQRELAHPVQGAILRKDSCLPNADSQDRRCDVMDGDR